MKHSFSTFTITFPMTLFFLLFPYCASSNNLLHDSCEKAAKIDPNFSYEFCVASFEANPRSQNATLEGLVAISMELTIWNATNIGSHITQLLMFKNFDKYAKICLQDCLELYSDANSTLLEAMNDFKSADYEGVDVKISSAMDAATTCEDGFKEKKAEVSPLTNENNIFFKLAAVTLAFINMFH